MRSCMADGDTWRNSGFMPPPGGGEFGAGVLNMPPGWFQQSHEVSLIISLSGLFVYYLYFCSSCTKKFMSLLTSEVK
jgi:hypothetical protein